MESDFGLTNYDTYLKFAEQVEQARKNVYQNIKQLKNQGLSLVGYGRPSVR